MAANQMSTFNAAVLSRSGGNGAATSNHHHRNRYCRRQSSNSSPMIIDKTIQNLPILTENKIFDLSGRSLLLESSENAAGNDGDDPNAERFNRAYRMNNNNTTTTTTCREIEDAKILYRLDQLKNWKMKEWEPNTTLYIHIDTLKLFAFRK